MQKFLKKNLITILLCFIFLTGVGLLLYPTVSDWWNSSRQSYAIKSYSEAVSLIDEELYREIWDNAVAYNERLKERESFSIELRTDEEIADYESQLNALGDGMMGYIDIAKIDCHLPIYHGTESGVLARNIGHLEGSSLPVGGEGTHSVLSGHRGLTSARLFTDLDRIVIGDTFVLTILSEQLTYEVDQILTVLPEETDALRPEAGMDYCTLFTCTPYGVNTHRLLVRGHRVPNAVEEEETIETEETVTVENDIPWPIIGAAASLVILILILLFSRTKKKKQRGRSRRKGYK